MKIFARFSKLWLVFGSVLVFVSVKMFLMKRRDAEPCERRRGEKRCHPGSFARECDDVVIQIT